MSPTCSLREGCNVILPGQVFDGQAGLHYNYFRDFDPALGRYVESDPIGLYVGSYSTYAYANGNAISSFDRFGLTSVEAAIADAIASGNVEALETLLEAADASQAQVIRAAIQRLTSTADQVISRECQAGVRHVFPKSVLNNSLQEIKELARDGAKTAWKLLNDLRFKK